MNGANSTGAEREAERAAGQVRRHRQALAVIGQLVDQRRGRRMERRAAEAAEHENRRPASAAMSPGRSGSGRSPRRAVRRSPARAAASDRRARRTPAATPSWPSGSTSPACRPPPATGPDAGSAAAASARTCWCRRRPRRASTRLSRSRCAGRASRGPSTGHPLEPPEHQVARLAELLDAQQLRHAPPAPRATARS